MADWWEEPLKYFRDHGINAVLSRDSRFLKLRQNNGLPPLDFFRNGTWRISGTNPTCGQGGHVNLVRRWIGSPAMERAQKAAWKRSVRPPEPEPKAEAEPESKYEERPALAAYLMLYDVEGLISAHRLPMSSTALRTALANLGDSVHVSIGEI